MKRRLLLQSGLSLWSAAWCGTAAWAGPSGSTIAAHFGKLPPPQRVRRVFAAGAPAGVLLAALAPEKLVGWPLQLSNTARGLLGAPLHSLSFVGRLAGRGSTVPLETLVQLQPDLILDSGTADATYISAAQRVTEQTGLPCVLVQGRLADHAAQLREVGQLLGVAERGERLAVYADAALALAAQLRASVPLGERPRVYFGRSADGMETGLDGSINLEVLDCVAGHNVAAAAGKGSLTRVSMEQILGWDPQVIVTQEPEFARRALSDPLWRSLTAVRKRRVYCAPVLPFGWLDGPPGVNRLIGVHWLAQLLHPTHPAVRALEPLAVAVQRFYRLFYGAELSPQALTALLGEIK
ncbi:MAG: ABC transporter substrate-binding protein [Burkholderiaceae bacterium]|jgi:iron complex transport system substrate-binding protein|nr:ABC transporter substrate-binding protein [Burkholderiaceae bacterium]